MQCEFEQELWGPHEGCREFMDAPEAVIRCENPAALMHLMLFNGPDDERMAWITANYWVYACADHPFDEDYVAQCDRILLTLPCDGSDF